MLSEIYKGSSLDYKRKYDYYTLAYVLSYFDFNIKNISILTSLDHRKVSEINKRCKKHHEKDFNTKQIRCVILDTILKGTQNLLYSQLTSLYVRLHRSSPEEIFDLDAFVKAWVFIQANSRLQGFKTEETESRFRNLDVNRFFLVCFSMLEKKNNLPVSNYATLTYSKKNKAYLVHPIVDSAEKNKYVQVFSIAEIDKLLTKQKEKSELKITSISPINENLSFTQHTR